MSKDNLRVGIAGYGVVGKRRRHFIDQHPKLRTVAVCDQYFKDSGGMFEDGVRFFTNYKQLLDEPLDILFVCPCNQFNVKNPAVRNKLLCHLFCKPGLHAFKSAQHVIAM